MPSSTPKNVLLITTDQQSATMLSCAGNPHLRTPNLDALAADGVRFEKAYAAQPLCVPQRCTWYTGLMPHEHGLTFNVHRPLEAPTMMGRVFREAHYATGYSGKWHVQVPEEDVEQHGFEWTNNLRSNGADVGLAPDFKHFLDQLGDQPFLFSASFNNPHNICEAARGAELPDGHVPMFENVDQLPPLPDNFVVPDREPSVIREVQRRFSTGNYPTSNWDEVRWRLHRWQYARMVELVDRHIGDVLGHLHDAGLADDTLVVFASDHGDGNAHHQWNQKQTLYDESARVPFIVARPGSGIGRVERRQLVNTGIDLIPTLCGLAGVACPDHLKGHDWSPCLERDDAEMVRDHLVIQTEFGTYGKPSGIMGRAIRTARHKYVVFNRGEHREFFADMDADPGETTNLVGDPAHAEALEAHREMLRSYIADAEDIFPIEKVGT